MSKGLKAWKIVKEYVEYCLDIRNGCEAIQWNSTYDFLKPFIDEIELILDMHKDIEKELKVLEIIKNRNIDAGDIKVFDTYSMFNQRRSLRGLNGIKKEEFDLLKEVLL